MPSSFLRLLFLCAAFAALATDARCQALPAAVNTDPARAQVELPAPRDPRLPSLILIGDSTVRNGRDDGQGKGPDGQWGWGHPLAGAFDPARVNVVNRAVGGLSSRTYLTSGHWARTLAFVKPGDIVLMQFGHNDAGPLNDTTRARGTIRGVGDETEAIDNLLTGQHEVVHSYGWYLRRFVADIRAQGATPVICSPIPHKQWDAAGRVRRDRDTYGGWAAQVARAEGAGFIDLNDSVARRYDALGHDAVMALFPATVPDEHTHTNGAGAALNAQMVVAGLAALRDPRIAAWLKRAQEDERPVVDAGSVRADAPRDPKLPTLFLVGDSTVKSGGVNGMVGWGERIAPFFDARRINVVDAAIGGRSSRTFFTEGRWDAVKGQLKRGDVVLIQFGHNDGGRIGDPAVKHRASGPGTGPETVADTRPDGATEQVHTFGWYMARYVADARAAGASAVLLAPVPHRDRWQDGRDFPDVAEWDGQVAAAGGASFIDLTLLVADGYRRIGAAQVDTLFADARTHTNAAGAAFNAERVVAGLKALPGNPLAPYFADAAPGAQSPAAQLPADTMLHALDVHYPTPYRAMDAAQVKAVLDRVLAYLERSTPAELVDKTSGAPLGDLARADPNAVLKPGDFRLASYEWGVTYTGMLAAGAATGERRYTDYAVQRHALLARLAQLYLPAVRADPEHAAAPIKGLLHPHALDDAGALCHSFLKAQLAGSPVDYRQLVAICGDFVAHKEYRLADGTLARGGPDGHGGARMRPLPDTLWLDDLFMAVPTLAYLGKTTGERRYYDDAARQVLQFSKRMFNPRLGLYMHGYVEGMRDHPEFHWARANGWAVMAMVELLEVLPRSHPRRAAVLAQLRAHIKGLAAYQSKEGLWHQLIDREDTYLETSASAIYAYAIARAVNRGYVDAPMYGPMANLAWNAVAGKVTADGRIEGICVGTGMAFDPAFYAFRPTSTQAAHGYGPTLLAGAEIIAMNGTFRFGPNDSALMFEGKGE